MNAGLLQSPSALAAKLTDHSPLFKLKTHHQQFNKKSWVNRISTFFITVALHSLKSSCQLGTMVLILKTEKADSFHLKEAKKYRSEEHHRERGKERNRKR